MKKLIVITGPTASGKTSLSIELALHYKSEIISADSRQFYKKLDIGTAKPGASDLKKVQHHFINFLDITENYNAGRFENDALKKAEVLFQKYDTLFLTGGSGLYIDALCNGVDELPETIPAIRNELNLLYKEKGLFELQQKLKEVDPEYFSETDINNPHRLIRALEVFRISGKKYSTLRKKKNKLRNFSIKKIGLLVDRDELYERINNRVDEMIGKGLVKEVKSLIGYRNENALQTVGYREIINYLDGKISLNEAIDQVKQNTRNYAKRQMTWFRRDINIHWFEPEDVESIISYIES